MFKNLVILMVFGTNFTLIIQQLYNYSIRTDLIVIWMNYELLQYFILN